MRIAEGVRSEWLVYELICPSGNGFQRASGVEKDGIRVLDGPIGVR
jgi:hypothetical protein